MYIICVSVKAAWKTAVFRERLLAPCQSNIVLKVNLKSPCCKSEDLNNLPFGAARLRSASMEELQARHRKEQRDLQNRITQKKKQANKKTRKGVNDECDRLEAELKAQQQEELAALNSDATASEPPGKELEDLTLNSDGDDDAPEAQYEQPNRVTLSATNGTSATHDASQSQTKKPNRQKARLARRAAEQEELARQATEDAKNLPDLKQQERERMLQSMKERGLQEREIRADGHCLYSAVADQLEQLRIPLGAAAEEKPVIVHKVVRRVAADYIEKHQDDFVPFLDEPLAIYLQKLRFTGEWGGQVELMALAKSYETDINVLQDFGRVEKIESGGGNSEKAMWLGYYKHGFGLGEHYNSLRKAP